jgi:HEPN domain-containing protein
VTESENSEEQRTQPLAFFNFAESYWQAARTLEKAKVKSTHPTAPVYFLYYQAIELYLKSFLRMHGHTAKELAGRKFGHRTCCLKERSEQLGLALMDEDLEIFSLMATTDVVIRSRYILTGAATWPTFEGLERVCNGLRQSIGSEMKRRRIPVRV